MAISLTGTGGLFTRLGVIIKAIRNINGFRGKTAISTAAAWGSGGPTVEDSDTMFKDIFDQYLALPLSQLSKIGQLYSTQSAWQTTVGNSNAYFQGLANDTVIQMANNDTPLSAVTLQKALELLNKQMIATSDSVKGNTVSVAVNTTGASNTGTPTVIASTTGANGIGLQYPFAETIVLRTITDAANGGTAGNEVLTAATAAITDAGPLDWRWPTGSGQSTPAVRMCNNAVDATGVNLLTNSDFETWSGSPLSANNWTKLVGTYATSIVKVTSPVHRGSACMSFVGDSSELTSVAQTFGSSSGTAATLLPSTVYAVSFWLYVASAAPAAGILSVDLVDSTPTIINDANGTANQKTYALTGITADTWTNVTAFFRTPAVLPSQISLRIRVSTAITTGTTVLIDDVAMCAATQMYTGGPYVAAFRGVTDTVATDFWNIVVANNYAGQFMTWMERLFAMRGTIGITLPYKLDASETVADTLVL